LAHTNQFRYISAAGVRPAPTTDFVIPTYLVGSPSLLVIVGRQVMTLNIDYVELNATTIRFLSPIPVEEVVTFWNVGGVTVPSLIDVSGTLTLAANSSQLISLNTGFDKYHINTVDVGSTTGNKVEVKIFNKAVGGKEVYWSDPDNLTDRVYDIPNIPCIDRDSTKKLHLYVKNHGNVSTTINIEIFITNYM
jgi:hypothetical protein